MSRREEILRRAEELRRQERETARQRKAERPYDGQGMDSEKMPLGCWMWIFALVGAVGYFIMNFVVH